MRVDFTTGAPVVIVADGNRIDGLNTVFAPRGLFFGVKFGNNPIVPGYSEDVTFDFTGDTPDADVQEGVTIYPAAPAPNQYVDFMVSFGPKRK